MKRTACIQILMSFLLLPAFLHAQGNVGIGTTAAPAEKLDVNGAIIVRGTSAASTAGTIRWNTTNGYHEGRTSAGSWVRLENEEQYLSGDYTALSYPCSSTSSTTIGDYDYNTPASIYWYAYADYPSAYNNSIENPFGTWWMNDWTQYLVTKSELDAAGICSGTLTSVGFIVVTPGVYACRYLTIKMKNVATTTLTTPITGMTTVWSTATTYMPVIGNNDFAISFAWDGVSNIAIDVCWDNTGWSTGCTVTATQGLSFNGSLGYYQDDNFPTFGVTNVCDYASYKYNTNRPQIRIQGPPPVSVTGTDNYIQFNKAVVDGSPSLSCGTHHGPGTLTAEILFDDNTVLSDYVFDQYYDGKVKKEDAEAYGKYHHYTIGEMKDFIAQYRHLPSIKGRDDWKQEGGFSLGDLLTQLWVTAEDEGLYVKDLHESLSSLETEVIAHQNEIREKYSETVTKIQDDPYLSDETKAQKIEQLNKGLQALDLLTGENRN